MKVFILSLTLVSALALKPGYEAGTEHQETGNCVDISYYDQVQYNESLIELCSYHVKSSCVKRKQQICQDVPVHSCKIVGYTDCQEIPTVEAVDDDKVVINQFSPQECVPGPVEVLTEMKNMPVCVDVTKQQCDSKWKVTEYGQKVFVSNENCHDVTWQECTMQLQPVTTDVPTWTCAPASPVLYQSVQHQPAEVRN